MAEEWLPVVGYEELYEVSNHGRVRSLDRDITTWRGGKHTHRGKILKLSPNGARAKQVNGSMCKDGIRMMFRVHQLVLEAFIGPRPPGMECCHEDGSAGNNHADNLRWDTHASNEMDKIGHGTSNRGGRNGQSKLTENQILPIIARLGAGESQRQVAANLGLDQSTISDIVTGRSWSWLTGLGEREC